MRAVRWTAWSLPVLLAVPLAAQSGPLSSNDADVLARIRDEANSRSQILRTVHFLADRYGPRLTGSPSLKAAGEWAVATMQSWGLTNGHLEPWNWGRDGWVNERLSAHIVSPVKDSLYFHATYVRPSWSRTKVARATIDRHIFYR